MQGGPAATETATEGAPGGVAGGGQSTGAGDRAGAQQAGERTKEQQAGERAKEAVNQGADRARDAMGQASGRLREQVDQRSTQAGERVQSTAGDLRSVGGELRKQGKDTPAKLAENAAQRVERVGTYMRDSDADRLLGDIENFGRRQPLAVLAGGLVVGFALSRFLKASSERRYQSYGSRPQLPRTSTAPNGGSASVDATPPVVTVTGA